MTEEANKALEAKINNAVDYFKTGGTGQYGVYMSKAEAETILTSLTRLSELEPIIQDWQPIETAPKDGTEIFAYREDAGVLLIRWTAPMDFLTDTEINSFGVGQEDGWQEAYGWFYADFIHGDRLECGDPAHWMPLPSPPTA